jgi:hypothetical protein
MSRSMEFSRKYTKSKNVSWQIPHQTRNSPSSFVPLEPRGSPTVCAEMEHTDPNSRITMQFAAYFGSVTPTPDNQPSKPIARKPTPAPHVCSRESRSGLGRCSSLVAAQVRGFTSSFFFVRLHDRPAQWPNCGWAGELVGVSEVAAMTNMRNMA